MRILVGEDEPVDTEFSSEMESLLDQVGARVSYFGGICKLRS